MAKFAEQIHFVSKLVTQPLHIDARVWYNVYYSCLPSRQRGLDSRHSHHVIVSFNLPYDLAIKWLNRKVGLAQLFLYIFQTADKLLGLKNVKPW